MRIAITGATGFLGARIGEMAVARGYDVVATGRDAAKAERLTRIGATFIPADITDAKALREIFDRADAVVHSAALSSPWGPYADFVRANVTGTRAVIAAAEAAYVPRLVHVSTASVYFAPKDQPGLTEDHPLPRPFNSYAATKQQAETIARTFAGDTMILRPRGIFGIGDTSLMPRLLAAAKRGSLPLLNGGKALTSVTHVDVVADAALAMIAAPAAGCGTYNVSHGEDIAVRPLVERLLGGLGVRYSWRAVPVPVALAGARLLEALGRFRSGHPEPITTVYALALFAYTQTLDISAIRSRLGWSPPLSLDEGLDRTIAAMRRNGAAGS